MVSVIGDFETLFNTYNIEITVAEVEERLSEEELLQLNIQDFDGTICGDDEYTPKVLEAAERLKVISKWGTGIDSIDVEECHRRGIKVFNTPNAFSEPVADTVLMYILNFARHFSEIQGGMHAGLWEKVSGRALNECTLGIIGVGNVGTAVARRAHAMGMQLYGNDIKRIEMSTLYSYDMTQLPLEPLLEVSDFVSLNCDLNPTSHHIIGRRELQIMKPTAFLINTARGPLIDTKALLWAWGDREIKGMALDVFEEEPLFWNHPLRALARNYPGRVFLSPHNANSSAQAWAHVHQRTVGNLIDGLDSS